MGDIVRRSSQNATRMLDCSRPDLSEEDSAYEDDEDEDNVNEILDRNVTPNISLPYSQKKNQVSSNLDNSFKLSSTAHDHSSRNLSMYNTGG